ncbi:MAG: SIMPL domain-containing protein [Patescibacteria group bacterium]
MNSWWSKAVIIFVAIWFLLKFGPSIPISSVVSQKQDFFTVTGEGKVTVVPDIGEISFGITSTGSSVKSAQTSANSVINTITASIKKLGIADKDIKTYGYSIYPQRNYSADANKIIGYEVSVTITVIVRDLNQINSVIDAATAAGVNRVDGLNLTVDDKRLRDLQQNARELAVKDAKTKAENLAKAAGISLGKIVNVQEGSSYQPYLKSALPVAGGGGGGDTQIQPGSTDITTSITLFYETR